jgi:hypothetical protein
MTRTRLCSVLFPIAVFMLGFLAGTANARDRLFAIDPKQEVVEYVNLGGSGHADGNMTVGIGAIDFFIKDPDGVIVQQFLNVSNVSFSFTADKDGNYSICMDNTYEAFKVVVELDYGVELEVNASAGIHFGTSAGTAIVVPPTRPPDLEDEDGSDYVVERYLTFQGAAQMLKVIESIDAFSPFRNVTLINCVGLAMALAALASLELCGYMRRPDWHGIRDFAKGVHVVKNVG